MLKSGIKNDTDMARVGPILATKGIKIICAKAEGKSASAIIKTIAMVDGVCAGSENGSVGNNIKLAASIEPVAMASGSMRLAANFCVQVWRFTITPDRAKQAGLIKHAITESSVGCVFNNEPAPASTHTPPTPRKRPINLRKLMRSASHSMENSAPNKGPVALKSAESAAGKWCAA